MLQVRAMWFYSWLRYLHQLTRIVPSQLEMTLVETTDANRDNIDDYMKQLEALWDEHNSLLSGLRTSLARYNASKAANEVAGGALSDSSDYDDSFDLLA